MKPLKVYVGVDRSQLLAVKVLEYSIKKHTNHPVEVIPMCDLDVPVPKDIKNQQRTGFSFSRFCIPQFMNYEGKAVYMDADMLVFRDIQQLFEWPLENHKILIQKPLEDRQTAYQKKSANKKRIRQCAVMVLDCSALDWDISKIVAAMDRNEYDYEKLMYDLCILKDSEVGEVLPFEWNSLEHFDAKTCLIHYTDMLTQPWVSPNNKYGYLWLREVKEMVDKKVLSIEEILEEVRLGYFRPSLLLDIYWHDKIPLFLKPFWVKILRFKDILSGYKAHRVVSSRVSLIKKRLALN